MKDSGSFFRDTHLQTRILCRATVRFLSGHIIYRIHTYAAASPSINQSWCLADIDNDYTVHLVDRPPGTAQPQPDASRANPPNFQSTGPVLFENGGVRLAHGTTLTIVLQFVVRMFLSCKTCFPQAPLSGFCGDHAEHVPGASFCAVHNHCRRRFGCPSGEFWFNGHWPGTSRTLHPCSV